MGPRLLCCMVTWLLGAGLTSAAVTQNPRHLVRRRGQEVILSCNPEKKHLYVYWYQQLPEEGPKFLVYLQEEEVLDDSGIRNSRFFAEFPKEGPKVLKIQTAELEDSAVYFCAGSVATSMQSHILAVHKHLQPLPQEQQWLQKEEDTCLCNPQICCKAFHRLRTEAGEDCEYHGAS
ncbi:T-cell receptor beta chain V region CTL-L17 [Heterocephalus glaber]|nr:T-cell receptor beta chain V region CTL-L17 [Heterocephalus glaber]